MYPARHHRRAEPGGPVPVTTSPRRKPKTTTWFGGKRRSEDKPENHFSVGNLEIFVAGANRQVTVIAKGAGADYWGQFLIALLREGHYLVDTEGFTPPRAIGDSLIPMKTIQVKWSESSSLQEGELFHTWQAAEGAFRRAALGPLDWELPNGQKGRFGYFKTVFVVTWEDGEEMARQIDLNKTTQSLIKFMRDESGIDVNRYDIGEK